MKKYFSPLGSSHEDKYADSPRPDIVDFIGEIPAAILEIGCGTGSTGRLIKEKSPASCYVGLEIDEAAASMAAGRLDKVISGDFEKLDLKAAGLNTGYFDLVICADVLEHLYDPWKALSILHDYLRPGGRVVASIPNVQNISVVAQLVEGNWTYTPFGLLDATHIRFFTWKEIEKLFNGTGFSIVKSTSLLQRNVDAESWPQDIDAGRLVIRNVTRDDAIMLFTFQYLVMGEKAQ